MAGTGT